jgi:hypothetical protein
MAERYVIFKLIHIVGVSICATAAPLRGMAYIAFNAGAYQTPYADQALINLRAIGTTHIEVLVTWYQDHLNVRLACNVCICGVFENFLQSTTIYQAADSPTIADLDHVMKTAGQLGFTVILKPHVDVRSGEWRGEIGTGFNSSQFAAWFASYNQYMTVMSQWASSAGVWAFNIGTEYSSLTKPPQTSDWEGVISLVRSHFKGPLLYGANWGPEPWYVGFWDSLDYIVSVLFSRGRHYS